MLNIISCVIIFTSLLICSLTNLSDADAASINASSCSQVAVQTAINSASNGDSVIVPQGNCTWNAQVSIVNKQITVAGAGIDKTVITANITTGSRPGSFKVTQQPARITGFTFNGTAPTNGAHIVFEGTGDETALFRVDHCKFTVNSGYAIMTWTPVSYGLIDNNTFTTTNDHTFIDICGDRRVSWGRASSLGTNKAVYIEDCTFTNSSTTANYRPVTTDSGARFVFRHNTVSNMALDAHGYCGDGIAGTFSYEIYDNTWSLTSGKNMFRWMFFRSGSGVVYNNAMTSSGSLIRHIDMTEYRAGGSDSCTGAARSCCSAYPCQDQIGRGTNQALDPLYYWNNTVNGSPAVISANSVIDEAWATSNSYSQNYFVIPRNYNGYYYSSTSAGTTGRTEPSWPTTVGNSVVDNNITWKNVCKIPDINTLIQPGRDYIDNGVTPKPGYTPYTYPHPLTKTLQLDFQIIP